jgi:hypothetical protein
MANPIFKYTDRTFNTIMDSINASRELRDKPEWFKRLWAGVGDVLSLCLNAQANDSYLETSFTEQSVDKLLQLIDYQRRAQTTSSGIVLFYIKRTSSFPVSLTISELVANTQGSPVVSSLRLEARDGVTISQITDSGSVNLSDNTLIVSRNGGYFTGDLIRINSSSTFPTVDGAPLDSDTDYYVIRISETKIKLSRTLDLAFRGVAIQFIDIGVGSLIIYLYSYPVTLYQQTTISSVSLGSSDGITPFQTFNINNRGVLTETLSISVADEPYAQVDNFVNSSPSDKVYKVLMNSDNMISILFGNGDGSISGYGQIPPNFEIIAGYATGGGALSNVKSPNAVTNYGGSSSDVDFVSNPYQLLGGEERESINIAKIIAPMLLKTRDRFVTVEDGLNLIANYGGIIQATIDRNYYGVGTCRVTIVPAGGGLPPSELKQSLQNFLIDRSVMGSIDVRVQDPVYNNIDFITELKIIAGYEFNTVKSFYVLAFNLMFNVLSIQIKNQYLSLGINSAIDLINSFFSTSFSYGDATQIQNILDAISELKFNSQIALSEVYGILHLSIQGLDFTNILIPSFPVTWGLNELPQLNSIEVNQI